jgi:hypothetical protein
MSKSSLKKNMVKNQYSNRHLLDQLRQLPFFSTNKYKEKSYDK